MLYKYIRLKKQIRSLFEQMKDLTCGNTEKMLDISLIDKDLECLAGVLNQYNAKQRLAVSGALQHEEHLKESIANISHDLRTPDSHSWTFTVIKRNHVGGADEACRNGSK